MGKCQKVPKFDFQSQFFILKIIGIFLNFFSLKNINLGAHFLLFTFFDNINLWINLFLKWCPIFDSSPLHQFSKFNNFLWACWFLGKILFNFLLPAWKLHNLYYHNSRGPGTHDWANNHDIYDHCYDSEKCFHYKNANIAPTQGK